jgi:alanine racemase
MIAVDVTGIRCRVGDTVTIIGTDGGVQVSAQDIAARIAGSPYELLTRLNPLIERVVV